MILPWIKVETDFLNKETLRFIIRRYGHDCLTFWMGVQTRADDGVVDVDIEVFSEFIFIEEQRLSEILKIFEKYRLIALDVPGALCRVIDWENTQVLSEDLESRREKDRLRQQRYRENQRAKNDPEQDETPKEPENNETPPIYKGENNGDVTRDSRDVTRLDKDKDKDKDKEYPQKPVLRGARRLKQKTDQIPGYRELIELIFEQHTTQAGCKPVFTVAEGAQIKRLLKAAGLATCLAKAREYYAGRYWFNRDREGKKVFSILGFVRNFNEFNIQPRASPRVCGECGSEVPGTMQFCPRCGADFQVKQEVNNEQRVS